MKSFFFSLVMLSVTGAYANTTILQFKSQSHQISKDFHLDSQNVSKYDQLITYFSSGTVPLEQEIKGLWSGRCYARTNPNSPSGSLLTANFTLPSRNENNGPLFPVTPSFNMGILGSLDTQADTFDILSPALRLEIDRLHQSPDFKSLVTSVLDGSLTSIYNNGNLKYVVRKYQNYFLAKTVALRSDQSSHAGDVYASCYYFKKVD